MRQKLLKSIYIVDGIVLIISFIYFFMVYLSASLQSIAYAVGSYELLCFQSDLQTIVEFGIYYETAVWFLVLFFFAILITAIFSALFYRKSVSLKTYRLLIFSPVPIVSPYILLSIAYLFVRNDISTSDPASGVCYIISLIIILIYAVFTAVFMCKDLKSFAVKR